MNSRFVPYLVEVRVALENSLESVPTRYGPVGLGRAVGQMLVTARKKQVGLFDEDVNCVGSGLPLVCNTECVTCQWTRSEELSSQKTSKKG